MSRPRSRSTSTPPQGCKSRHGNGAEEFHVPASGHGPVHTPCYVPKCWGCLGQWSARVCTRSLHPLLDFPQRTCALLWAAGVFLRRALCPRTPRGSDHATYSTPCALRCTLFACAWRPTPFAPWVSLLSPFHCTGGVVRPPRTRVSHRLRAALLHLLHSQRAPRSKHMQVTGHCRPNERLSRRDFALGIAMWARTVEKNRVCEGLGLGFGKG